MAVSESRISREVDVPPEVFRRFALALLFFLNLNIPLRQIWPDAVLTKVPLLPDIVGWIILGTVVSRLAKGMGQKLEMLQRLGIVFSLLAMLHIVRISDGLPAYTGYLSLVGLYLAAGAEVLMIWHISEIAMAMLRSRWMGGLARKINIARIAYPAWLVGFWISRSLLPSADLLAPVSLTYRYIILIALIVMMRKAARRLSEPEQGAE